MQARLGFSFCIVELKAGGTAIGICGLAQRDYLDDVDIGYALLSDYCGQGYALEAALAVREYARTTLGLTRLLATIRPGNAASEKLLEKLGLSFVRMMRNPDGDRELKLFAVEFQ